jgi:hypothetical protein
LKLVLLLVCGVAGAFGQQLSIQVIAPSVRLTAGDTMRLTAVVLTGDTPVTQPVSWKVDQPSIATIDSSGNLTGVSLGIVKVTASFGEFSHDTIFQVTPDHTVISPPSAELMIGDQMQFTATAFDKKGKPIPNVNFTWAVVSNDDDGTPNVPYGKISASGMLTAGYEGSAYVRALYTYVSQVNVEAGMESRIPLYAPFVASAPRPFQVTQLLNATRQQRDNPLLRSRPSLLWASPDGGLFFNASLDGVATALMKWDGAASQTVLATGTPSNSPGSIVTDLGRHSMSASGVLMTQEATTDGGLVQLGTPDALQPLLVTNISGAGVEALNGFNLSRNSLSAQGYFVFTGNFRIPGTSIFATGIFRGFRGSVNELLFSQLDNLPELGVSGVNVADFGVDNKGVAWYVANLPGKLTMYRHDDNGRRKFLGIGDPLLGSSVRTFFGGRNSSSTSLFAENGDVIIGAALNDGTNYLLRYTGADATQPAAKLQVDNAAATLSYQNGSVLLYGNPHPNQGDGAWLWNGDSLQQIALIGKTTVNGQPIQSIESGVIDSSGRITLMVATAGSPMVVIRAAVGASPQALFEAGDPAQVASPTELAGFVIGARNGNPMLLAGSSNSASIAEWRDGSVQPLLSLGDRVLGGTPFVGINPNGYAQRTANGDLYTVLAGVGIGRYRGGQWDVALPFPIKLEDGAAAGGPYRIAVNNAGAIVWGSGTDKGDTRIYLSQNGQNQVLCANGVISNPAAVIDGQAVYSCDDFYLDDQTRVFLRLHFQGDTSPRTYVWNNGNWQLAVELNKTQIGGRAIASINLLRPMGSRFFATLQTDAGTFVGEWTDAGWSVLLSPIDKMPTGFLLTNVNQLEANPAGDLVFVSQAYPSFGVFFQRAGQISTVLTTGRRTADGDYLVTILGLDMRDDGTVYLLALNEKDELVFYAATPM